MIESETYVRMYFFCKAYRWSVYLSPFFGLNIYSGISEIKSPSTQILGILLFIYISFLVYYFNVHIFWILLSQFEFFILEFKFIFARALLTLLFSLYSCSLFRHVSGWFNIVYICCYRSTCFFSFTQTLWRNLMSSALTTAHLVLLYWTVILFLHLLFAVHLT